MTENLPRQPDIEIYVKRVELPDMLDWIGDQFNIVDQKSVGSAVKLTLADDQSTFPCTVIENAVKGGYSSICFESSTTPWTTDEECARQAHDHFHVEIRCSVSGWTPENGDSGGWYRFTENERSVVNWLT